MFYNLIGNSDRKAAQEYLDKLLDKKCKIELKELRNTRTIDQNAFLHVVINLYAIAYGFTLEEAKTHLKRKYGLFYEKKGEVFIKRTRDMNTKEMSAFIDWIRNRAAQELGYYIPTAEEYLINKYTIDKEIDNNREFL